MNTRPLSDFHRSSRVGINFKDRSGGKVEISFSDTKRKCTIDLSGLSPDEKVARIRAQILAEGYFYSTKIEKKVNRRYG